MIKSSLIIFFCCIYFFGKSQENCQLIKDRFYLISLDIRQPGQYPIIMKGVTKKNLYKSLKRENADSLLQSFYNNAYYVPDIRGGYSKMIVACMGGSGYKYLKEHQLYLAKLTDAFNTKGISRKFKLASKGTVYFTLIEVAGSFWKTNKDDIGISTSSNEEDIKTIRQIQTCYVPFKINILKQPKNYFD